MGALSGMSGESGLSAIMGAFDSNAQAYFTAADITNAAQKAAINQLFIDLKAASIYSKINALYLPIQADAVKNKWNLVNPVDTDGAYRLTFNGGITHASGGVTCNGTTGYIDTHIIPATEHTTSNGCYFVYNRTNVAGGHDMSSGEMPTPAKWTSLITRFAGDAAFGCWGNAADLITSPSADSRGLWCLNRLTLPTTYLYRNGVEFFSNGNAAVAMDAVNSIYISAMNQSGTAAAFSAKQIALAGDCDGLTPSEHAALYTAIQTMMTTLGLNV